MQAWLCENPTGPDALRWNELPTPEPTPGEVRVAIHAASLNFPDLLIVQNKYQFKPRAAVRAGLGVRRRRSTRSATASRGCKVGDAVAAFGGTGGFAHRTPASTPTRLMPLPAGLRARRRARRLHVHLRHQRTTRWSTAPR